MTPVPVLARLLPALAAALLGLVLLPAPARAHGIVGRADLPLPEWLFGWAAAAVLVVSFVALAILWPAPRLERQGSRPLLRVPLAAEVVAGAAGVALFVGLVYTGLVGAQTTTDNLFPTFVYVVFWVGLAVLSALVGDVFRALNPWRALGRAGGWALARVSGAPPEPLPYPEPLGRWPAFVGIVAFGWVELVASTGDVPRTLAILALVYAAVQLVGQSLYGVEAWSRRGDAFGVYFGLFARLAPLAVVDGRLVARRPLSGLTGMDWLPGTVALVCAAIGITAFDGASEGALWGTLGGELQQAFMSLGVDVANALELSYTIGLLAAIAFVAGIWWLGVAGVRTVSARWSQEEVSRRFAHSLVPIALAYLVAHYFSLVVFQGQGVAALVSDPLGTGADWFGTATAGIDYGVVSMNLIWYVQVLALVLGHVAALVLAHDRALVVFGQPGQAVRSQYWMLVVMVGFTSLGLWLLAQANA